MPDGAHGAGWTILRVAETGSTNADLASRARLGALDRTVLVADVQRAGRGRMGREWLAPAGTALLFSVLLRPRGISPARLGWAGAILGIAVTAATRGTCGLTADLKWPNDVLIDGRKVAGILAELAGDALVVGAGINVSLAATDLPRSDATSLVLAGAAADRCGRAELLDAILQHLGPLLDRWEAARGDVDAAGIRAAYLARSATVGRAVAIHLPGGGTISGLAVDVASDGSLVIDVGGEQKRFAAGDVEHLRGA